MGDAGLGRRLSDLASAFVAATGSSKPNIHEHTRTHAHTHTHTPARAQRQAETGRHTVCACVPVCVCVRVRVLTPQSRVHSLSLRSSERYHNLSRALTVAGACLGYDTNVSQACQGTDVYKSGLYSAVNPKHAQQNLML